VITTIDPSQRTAAKVAGVVYLVAMATSMFAELALRGPLMVRGNAVQTVLNIAEAERLFRISSVIHLLTFATDAVLAVALYAILKPVNRHLALLAAFWRLADCAILAGNVVTDFAALRFVSDAEYLRSFAPAQLQALARVYLSIGTAGYQVGFVFLGLGSAVFSVLWLQSRYIPRLLAGWGIFASLTLALVTVAVMLFPALGAKMGLAYMAPMFIYEVGLGLWLLIKGLPR
jgi:Domain of unknown function (DUF4386)